MPYATNGAISRDPIENGLQITDEQYTLALAGMLEGKVVSIDGGFKVERPPEPDPETPQPPTFEELRADKETEINWAYATAAAAALSEGYPDAERETWPVQIMESAAVLAGAEVSTPWIDAAAPARGITREELAVKIRDMDVQYRQISGALTGKRQALRDLVQAAATPEDLALIVWN
ncbi:hypothetical protein P3W70_06980 [Achromobacter denitrificans]|uniref:hypothetical protein n=1 Tax=Achromobacter denitrificans TaxID=32002 RepID=UPI0023E8C05F|nr:hypothetical protein [Achromobacter denitrificans]MDF3858082.1 hypothetical protein [Achromobacter denitrificans]